jgi:hypothetical protein
MGASVLIKANFSLNIKHTAIYIQSITETFRRYGQDFLRRKSALPATGH